MTVKISQLPAAGSVAGTDELEANQAGTSRKVTAAQIRAGMAASGAVGSSGLTMNTARLLGRATASSGAVEEITLGTGLSLTGGALVLSSQPQLREQLFTSGGTWTAPAGVTQARIVVIGAGGGGGGASTGGPLDGTQGGSGGIAVGNVTVVPGTAYTVTVGTAGTGGATNISGTNGTGGGTSSFGALMSATGGGAGRADGGFAANGTGSSGTTRNTNISVAIASPFGGSIVPRAAGSGSAAVAWTISSTTAPGVPGGGAIAGGAASAGGVGGLVYVQWVG